MNEETKLTLAKIQVMNVLSLIKDNSYETYMHLKLTSVYYELERQLTNLNKTSKIKK